MCGDFTSLAGLVEALPFAIVGMIVAGLITTIALLVFHIPFRGSPVLLVFCSALYLMTTLGAGLLLSTISATQQQTMNGQLLLFNAGFCAQRLRLSDPQHARRGAVFDLLEPAAIFH
jgi:ABC-type multidrug transport system permease subunit